MEVLDWSYSLSQLHALWVCLMFQALSHLRLPISRVKHSIIGFLFSSGFSSFSGGIHSTPKQFFSAGPSIPSSLFSCMAHSQYMRNTHIPLAPSKRNMQTSQFSHCSFAPTITTAAFSSPEDFSCWNQIPFHCASKLQEIHTKLQGVQLKPWGEGESTPTLPP